MANPAANPVSTTGICLYDLPAREEAVLKRVISFSSTQGRNYTLAEPKTADMLVLSDEANLDPALMNPAGCLLIRIADAGTTQVYDVLMQRPLLVTKVMRTLDEAKVMLADKPSVESTDDASSTPLTPSTGSTDPAQPTGVQPVAPVQPAAPEKPKPAMSLYAQILGGGAKAAVEAQAESSAPVAEQATNQEPAVSQNDDSDSVPSVAAAEVAANNSNNNTATPQDAHHLALVVDDSAAIRKQLELELRAAGIGAEFAETGEEAMEKVAAKRYDLVFLDIIMPGIDGYETCRQMRLRADLKKTPIIMLSAKTSPLDEVQGVIAGASTYLTKPVKSDQLQQTLKRVSMWLDNFQVSV